MSVQKWWFIGKVSHVMFAKGNLLLSTLAHFFSIPRIFHIATHLHPKDHPFIKQEIAIVCRIYPPHSFDIISKPP
jgi:hypothetical protein